MSRKSLPIDTRRSVLHQAGYRCGNPVCRTILTLDIHHLDPIANDGFDGPDNLLALCPNCHALHHREVIPQASLHAWKMLLLAMNEAFDRRSVDLLLTLDTSSPLIVSGEGVLDCAALIAGGLVQSEAKVLTYAIGPPSYILSLTERGKSFVASWKSGDQGAAIRGSTTET